MSQHAEMSEAPSIPSHQGVAGNTLSPEVLPEEALKVRSANSQMRQDYEDFHDWVCDSLEIYKHELFLLSFPLFVHVYLKILGAGKERRARRDSNLETDMQGVMDPSSLNPQVLTQMEEDASAFFQRFSADHNLLNRDEIRYLSSIRTKKLVDDACDPKQREKTDAQEYIQDALEKGSQYFVCLSQFSMRLLNNHLRERDYVHASSIVNERIHIQICPDMTHDFREYSQQTGLSSFRHNLVKSALKSQNFRTQLKNFETETAGTKSKSELGWGVLPMDIPVRVAKSKVASKAAAQASALDASSKKTGGSNQASGAGKNGAVATSASSDKSKQAGGNKTGQNNKTSQNNKVSQNSKAAQNNKTPAAQKTKLKAYEMKKEQELHGPLPDKFFSRDEKNNNSLSKDHLLKVVFKKPPHLLKQHEEDAKARVKFGPDQLPSVLFGTLFNAHGAINCIDISSDLQCIAAGTEDSLIKIWYPMRNETGRTSSKKKQEKSRTGGATAGKGDVTMAPPPPPPPTASRWW
jgi:hypothetical protein